MFPQTPPSVVKMENYSPKTRPRTPILFINNSSKATYKYFNYFGPWTADVQGPPLNSSMMIVIMTILNDRPVPTRALTGRAHCRHTPRPPAGANLKFRELFAAHPSPAGSLKKRK